MMRFCYVGILISTMSCFEFFLEVSFMFPNYLLFIYILSALCLVFFYFGGWMNQIVYPVYHPQNVGLHVGVGYEYFCRFYESNGCLEKFLGLIIHREWS
jgi:hypothetical protein